MGWPSQPARPRVTLMLLSMTDCCSRCTHGDALECACSKSMITRCQNRISDLLMDRINIREVPRVEYERLSRDRLGEPTADTRERVEAPRRESSSLRRG